MSEDVIFHIELLRGHIEMQSRQFWSPDGQVCEFQGRSLHLDRNGVIVKTTPWETSGRLLYEPEPSPPRPWWRFWS